MTHDNVGDHGLDLPFEAAPGGPFHAPLPEDTPLCGGVVVRAAAIPSPVGLLPALVFDFHQVDGQALQPIVLVGDADQIGKLAPLIQSAVAAALKATQ